MKPIISLYNKFISLAFVVCIVITGLLVIVKLFVPSFIENHWDWIHNNWSSKAEKTIKQEFQARVEQLVEIANKAANDTIVMNTYHLNNPEHLKNVFEYLKSIQPNGDGAIDLVDEKGNLIAWSGSNGVISNRFFEIKKLDDYATFLFQKGLKIYLNVAKQLGKSKNWIIVSEPLELNIPISNRFFDKISFCEYLSEKVGTKVLLRLPNLYKPKSNEILFPVLDNEGNEIALFIVEDKNSEQEVASIAELNTKLISLFIALSSIFLLLYIINVVSKINPDIESIVIIIFIFAVRILWFKIEFPAVIIGGWLFDSNVFSSHFAYGLTNTFGELIITVLFLLISTWIIFSTTYFNKKWNEVISKFAYRIKPIGAIILFIASVLLLMWLFRGFAEALRSFVFDSNIRFSEPEKLIPSVNVVFMYVNIILLGFSLMCVVTSVTSLNKNIMVLNFNLRKSSVQIMFLIFLFVCIYIFVLIDNSHVSLIYFAIAALLFGIIGIILLDRWNADAFSQKWKIAIYFLLISFLISMPVLHNNIHKKSKIEIESMLNEFIQPNIDRFTNVIEEAVRSSNRIILDEIENNNLLYAKEMNLAFYLWSKSPLGREGYNSAIILYNESGEELDRFVVGMTREEQKNILTRTFEGEEEIIHTINKTESNSLNELYGIWSVIRKGDNRIVGIMAVLLSGNQRNIFEENEIDPLRHYEARLSYSNLREIAIHEFLDNKLIFSSGKKLLLNQLDLTTKEAQNLGQGEFVWKRMKINDSEAEIILKRDPGNSERVVAISLEYLDFRWELFDYLKEISIVFILIILIGVFIIPFKIMKTRRFSLGFGEKLFIAFGLIILLSLSVLSYYDKKIALDHLMKKQENELYNQLRQMQEKINMYISDEEDFYLGVDDEFCKAFAAEYQIDFSVYRNYYLQASSRPELFKAGILNERLSDNVYLDIILNKKRIVLSKEKIGAVEYIVGYSPIILGEEIVGVVSVPTLYKHNELDIEIAQRNAYVLSIYAIVFGIALIGGGFITFRFTKPLNDLTKAANEIAGGNLNVKVIVKSSDEVGKLANSFNDMVQKIKINREELAKNERENAWREMAKQVAHEIRNPLTPLKLSIQHLRQAFKDNANDREQILDRVTQSAIEQIETLSRISTEFSRFAKMPEGKYERININELLRETINLFKEVQGIHFIENLSACKETIIADKDQMRSVFINIVRNAIQAIEKEGNITIETFANDKICIIRIADTGVGVPEEIRARIFEPNFSTKTEGLGLGLAIAKRIVENHGGTIRCFSDVGKGTTFEIRLPL